MMMWVSTPVSASSAAALPWQVPDDATSTSLAPTSSPSPSPTLEPSSSDSASTTSAPVPTGNTDESSTTAEPSTPSPTPSPQSLCETSSCTVTLSDEQWAEVQIGMSALVLLVAIHVVAGFGRRSD